MSRFQDAMNKFAGGHMSVTYDDQKRPVVHTDWDHDSLTYRHHIGGDEAMKFLAKYDRRITVLSTLFLPVSLVFWTLVGIHNGIEWLLGKFFGAGK